jgi:hypothetical protein
VEWAVDANTTVPVQITYDPGKITMASQDLDLMGDKTLHDVWEERIVEYVKGWDIMGDDGQLVPITPEGVAQLETALVQTILTAINEDAVPKPKTSTGT